MGGVGCVTDFARSTRNCVSFSTQFASRTLFLSGFTEYLYYDVYMQCVDVLYVCTCVLCMYGYAIQRHCVGVRRGDDGISIVDSKNPFCYAHFQFQCFCGLRPSPLPPSSLSFAFGVREMRVGLFASTPPYPLIVEISLGCSLSFAD